jgi:hypothetical protein
MKEECSDLQTKTYYFRQKFGMRIRVFEDQSVAMCTELNACITKSVYYTSVWCSSVMVGNMKLTKVLYIYIYIYIYVCVCVCIYMKVSILTWRKS